MADLNAIIRLHKHEIDEMQRVLAEQYDALDTLNEHRTRVLDQRKRELEASRDLADTTMLTISGFLEKSKREEIALDEAIKGQEAAIEEMRDHMMEAFAELKKFELTQEERDRLEEKERKLKEGRMFDDIAIQGFRTQTDGEG